jgi:hypothetical protein
MIRQRWAPFGFSFAFLLAVSVLPACGAGFNAQDAAPMPTPIAGEAPVAVAPAPVVLDAGCCNAPCITYLTKRPCRKACCGCEPPISTVLTVPVPRECDSYFEVPVCIPACCCGEPTVKCRKGVFNCGVVTYRWCCGYKLTVTFKKCGDVLVTYYGS